MSFNTWGASPPELKELDLEIKALVRDQSCLRKTDCAVVGVGSRPCGGPEKYVIYSRIKTPSKKLKTLVSRYNELDKASKAGKMGVCIVATKPAFACVARKCQLQFVNDPAQPVFQ